MTVHVHRRTNMPVIHTCTHFIRVDLCMCARARNHIYLSIYLSMHMYMKSPGDGRFHVHMHTYIAAPCRRMTARGLRVGLDGASMFAFPAKVLPVFPFLTYVGFCLGFRI